MQVPLLWLHTEKSITFTQWVGISKFFFRSKYIFTGNQSASTAESLAQETPLNRDVNEMFEICWAYKTFIAWLYKIVFFTIHPRHFKAIANANWLWPSQLLPWVPIGLKLLRFKIICYGPNFAKPIKSRTKEIIIIFLLTMKCCMVLVVCIYKVHMVDTHFQTCFTL